MNHLVSVIVPIYNVEKYLRKCIESIINQDYLNLEIILVNDGSPDNCLTICEEYLKKDQRIRLINKKNGGLSDARNVAIDIASGEFISFIDSDDYVESDYISSLINLVTGFDVKLAVTLANYFKEGKKVEVDNKSLLIKKFSASKGMESMLYQEYFDNSAWGKIYHRSLFENIRYPVGLLYEDVPVTYKLIIKSNGIAFSNKKTYNYLLREDSIEGSAFNEKKYLSYLKIVKDLEDSKKQFYEYRKAFNCRLLSLSFHLLFESTKGTLFEKEIFKNVQKYRMGVLFDSKARKKARLAALLSFVGSKTLRFFYRFGNYRSS